MDLTGSKHPGAVALVLLAAFVVGILAASIVVISLSNVTPTNTPTPVVTR